MIWENGIETCKISHVKQITSPGLMHDTRGSVLVQWDDPKGGGREVRRAFRMGNTCTLMADSSQCMAKSIQYYKVI